MSYKITFIFLFCVLTASSQNRFASQSLEVLWGKLSVDCQNKLLTQKECDCVIKGSAFRLRIELDGDKIIHLGIKVFNDSIPKADNPYVYWFIERELLQFTINDEQGNNVRQLEDKVYLYHTNNFQNRSALIDPRSIHNVVSGLTGVSIKQDSLSYKVLLVNQDAKKVEIEFPKDNALIRGMDKKELDDFIYSELLKDIKDWQKRGNNFVTGPLKSEKNLLVSEGDSYLIKGLSSNKYYKQLKDSIVVLFQPDSICTSLSNLFLTDLPYWYPTQLGIKVKGYGGRDQLVLTSVGQFLAHFDSQSKLYFGVESTKPDGIRGSLVIYCPALNYIHLLDVKTTATSLFEDCAKVSGTLYPYIPTHNIKDLFDQNNGNVYESNDLIEWE